MLASATGAHVRDGINQSKFSKSERGSRRWAVGKREREGEGEEERGSLVKRV